MLDKTEFKKILLGANGDQSEVRVILEDNENPIQRVGIEKLYQSVQEKGHVDFGSIANSRGSVTAYSGYASMQETLSELSQLASQNVYATKEFASQVGVVTTALDNLYKFDKQYKQAYLKQVTPIMLEYNSFLATCVEATTSLLYTFIDYVKDPRSKEVKPIVTNTKQRGGLFYIDQLAQYNAVCASGQYEKYLNTAVNSGSDYFLGVDDAVVIGGAAIVATVAMSIVPVTRKVIYTFQNLRRKLSDCLELQAYFLELNRTVVEANSEFSATEREAIIKKQDALRLKFLRLADKIRVESKRDEELSKKALDKDNSVLTASNIREQIDNSDIVLA